MFADFLARLSFNGKERERCWTKTATLLASTHISVEQHFKKLRDRARQDKKSIARVYEHIVREMSKGRKISEAVAKYSTPEEVMLIEAAQTAGENFLADGFRKAAQLMQRKRKIRGLLIKQLSYPAFLMLGVVGFLIVIANFIVPQLTALSDPETWTGAAATLYGISSFVSSWQGAVTALAIGALGVAIIYSLKRLTGPVRDVLDRFPPWSIYRLVCGASWLYATAMMLQTKNLKLETILRNLLSKKETSRYMASRLKPIHIKTMAGNNLGEALYGTKTRWPDAGLADDFRTYAALPNFNELLGGIAERVMDESMEKIERGTGILGVLALFMLVIVIALLVAGIFGIQDQITKSIGA